MCYLLSCRCNANTAVRAWLFIYKRNYTDHKIKTDLKPVIRVKDEFELDETKKTVTEFLKQNLYIIEQEQLFLKNFKNGYYKPELLFYDEKTLSRVKNHPMAIWKTNNNRDISAR